jgi:uncharacterized protein (DUF1499 family)
MSLFRLSGKTPSHLREPASNTSMASPPKRPNYATSHPDAKPPFAVEPLHHPGPPVEAFAALIQVLSGLGGVTVAYERAPEYLWATCSTKLMGFVDDLECHLSASPNGTRIDVRSAARLGMRDFGVNRSRIEAIRLKLAGGGN